jgi:hypothetical protein
MNCTRCSFPFDASAILADDETAWHGFCPGCEKEETEERFRNSQAVMREEAAKNPPKDLLLAMNEPQRIRGMYPWDAKGRVFSEIHPDHKLKNHSFRGVSLKVNNCTKYFYFDHTSLRDAEEQALELWETLRKIRKESPQAIVLMEPIEEV